MAVPGIVVDVLGDAVAGCGVAMPAVVDDFREDRGRSVCRVVASHAGGLL